MCVSAIVCGDLRTFENLYPVSPGDGAPTVRLSGRRVYPLNHPAHPISHILTLCQLLLQYFDILTHLFLLPFLEVSPVNILKNKKTEAQSYHLLLGGPLAA